MGEDPGQAGAFQLANVSISGVVRQVLPLPFEMMVSCKQLSSFFVVWKDKILHLAFWKSLEVHSQCGSGYVLGYEWLMRIGAV